MKKLTGNFIAKITAAFLFAFTIMSCCITGACTIGSYLLGFYSIPKSAGFSAALSLLENASYDTAPELNYPSFFEGLFNFRYWAVILFVVALSVSIVLFIFLMCAAGHKGGDDGIHLGFFDRIPLDLTLAADLALGLLAVYVLAEEVYWNYFAYGGENLDVLIVGTLLVCLVITFVFMLLLSLSSTFAARVKAGKWWRNSVIYCVLRFIFRCIRSVWRWCVSVLRAMPVVWKAVVGAGGFLILELALSGWAFSGYEPMGVFLLIILDFAVFCGVILAAFQMKNLKEAGENLASGSIDFKTDTTRMFWDFKRHGENLNSIGDGMSAAVDQRMRSERLKTELITNVSHDIKTPLTNIVNYVDLLQKEPASDARQQYLEVLSRQSARLKKLTVDLVEASKASTGNVAVELQPTSTQELINQSIAEYAEKFSAGKLEPVVSIPDDAPAILADGRHLWRVLDNLFNNAVKYAQPGTRIYVDVVSSSKESVISIKNISRERLNVSEEELMERFVRGDTARHTEGSGLGLSIARSLTELMGGSFNISIDGDLFKAKICLKTA